LRRVWAPKGQRPIALGHHRYKWLYVTAFVQPISGETFWYISNGVSKLQRDNQDDGRIASPEMFPNVEPLPHLKCSRPGWGRRGSDEAGEHGDAG